MGLPTSPPSRSEPLAWIISADIRQLVNSQSAFRVDVLVLTNPPARHPATLLPLVSSILPVLAQFLNLKALSPFMTLMKPAMSALAPWVHFRLPLNSQPVTSSWEVLDTTNPLRGKPLDVTLAPTFTFSIVVGPFTSRATPANLCSMLSVPFTSKLRKEAPSPAA